MDNKSFRIRTTPGQSGNVLVKIEQDFDFLEILSLKISQQDLYTTFCANYGVVVGRVIANKGYGVPNAKVSVFVPISSEDEKNQLIKDLYPYKTVNSKDKNNVRYNLLLSKATCDLNTPVGTFPTKEEVLNNDIMIEVFEKYYKYTTKTNESGDYMIFGVPTGQQVIHMDTDLSDTGILSPRPYDFIDSGFSEKLFKSRTEFKSSNNLDGLPQIKSSDRGVDVIPFWGDIETCEVGITRVDFEMNFDFQPTSILMGSVFTDNAKNALSKRCNPDNEQGRHDKLRTGPGVLEVIRVKDYKYDYNSDPVLVPLSLEKFTLPQGLDVIDENGAFVVTVPLNLDHVITNEFGELIPSNDPEVGIPTKGMYRFKLKFSEPPAAPKIRTAQLIFPTLNRHTGGSPIDTNIIGAQNNTENARWVDDITVYNNVNGDLSTNIYLDFHKFEFNQIYSISQYIPKYKKGSNKWSFLGIKDVDNSTHNPFPFTTAMRDGNPTYTLLKLMVKLQTGLMKMLIILSNFTLLFCANIKIKILGEEITILSIDPVKLTPFGFLRNVAAPDVLECESHGTIPIGDWSCDPTTSIESYCKPNGITLKTLTPTSDQNPPNDGNTYFCPKYKKVDDWECCTLYDLAISQNVIQFTFHDAWLTGSAYLPQFNYKSRIKSNDTTKDKFCGPGGDNSGGDNYKNQKCCDRGGDYTEDGECNKCIVRGYDKQPLMAGEYYHTNSYKTGASDTDDLIYCPESFPVKIVNLGSRLACQDVLDTIDRCIVSQECMLDLYQSKPCSANTTGKNNCLTGTYYEDGYDSTVWVDEIGNTSFQDPSLVILNLMSSNCSKGVEGLFRGQFKTGCAERECDDDVWRQIRQISKIYTDIIIEENPLTGIEEWVGYEYDKQQTPRFNPSWPTGEDNDETLGDNKTAHHLANVPYFYFGLTPGSTAMDRLRKEYM